MKKIFSILKKIILSGLLLYGYNMIAISYGTTIPMNIVTIGSITILGIPALFALILIQKIVF